MFCDLPYDSYNVTITVFYNDAFEHNGDQSYDFWLDAIRVYDPMGKNADYTTDKEGYPQYINLRDQIAASGSNVGIKNTLFIDGSAEAEVADYINLGPNNEVYLAKGQAISFKLPANDNIEKVQIGAKAPNGAITITNISGSDITGQIYVYYKSAYGDLYIGGITYRTGVSGLAAGESTTLYASHYSTAYSKIMFVTYVQ